ncbi:16S rRNA (guanine(966)-N(2))-methyltransferase RsmD [Hippea jasoniae]|uniref:16S rRNA (guanine(966)-N(2))-methyltransferase RsmD n=1 Tax=Hippea jasoniae TaxID=944479 RepID=UPI00068DBAE2|nr:16S rRNA (guanine(966)-N(2))-methyltransferase RsmD [Hippea jasoniae]
MRVIAGAYKYKKLKYKRNRYLRPTRSIVRKSFFDTVRGLLEESVFIDLFAGSGSIGVEALSRGAKEVVFVDNSSESVELIRNNVKPFSNATVKKIDARRFLDDPVLDRADLVYVDPPYDFNLKEFLVELFEKINQNAIVCVEHDKYKPLDDRFGRFKKIKSRSFGKNTLDYFGVKDE